MGDTPPHTPRLTGGQIERGEEREEERSLRSLHPPIATQGVRVECARASSASADDLSGFDRKFGLDQFPPEFVRQLGSQLREQAREQAKGAERLAAYLAAPPEARAKFDDANIAAIERDLAEERELDEWIEAELGDDPVYRRVQERRRKRAEFEAWLVEQDA